MPDALAALTRINLDDLIGAFGVEGQPLLAALARGLFRGSARRFARQMLDFDGLIATQGLRAAAAAAERNYARSVRVYGRDRLPSGPVLFVANHPGMTDTLALLAAIDRADLRVIALDRPFLVSLPNLSNQLSFVSESLADRAALVRNVGRHLRKGGAVLTFPAGRNEADPDYYADAAGLLQAWTDSASAFVRLAPELSIVPVCVRGVLWPRAMDLAPVRSRPDRDEQLLLGSALQLLGSVALGLRPVSIRVEFGAASRLGAGQEADASKLHANVIEEMRRLMLTPPSGPGEQVL